MQMAAVEIVRVTVVMNGEMAAIQAVLMLMGLTVFAVGGATASQQGQWKDEEQ